VQIIPQDILKKYIMYSKEHIKPKLHQLDQDKLARLYADLRRESLATGSFPITVRHLESMIRMSEASAKMHLREYVRSDDIDLAIQVTVGSFVNAQKMSIKKTLERVSLSSFSFIMSSSLLAKSQGEWEEEMIKNYKRKDKVADVPRDSENTSTNPPTMKN
jgi:DNA replicative helicase MCM subunit Mcm2 (Cdc46/Mcm family)